MKCLYSSVPKYDHVIKWCLEDILRLEGYELKVIFCVLFNEKGNFQYPNIIHIDQHLDELETLRVLFHEIRHYYQYVTDMFDFDFEKYIKINTSIPNGGNEYNSLVRSEQLWWEEVKKQFKKCRHAIELYESYLNFPWELDATKFATKTYGKYLESGIEDCKKHLWHGNYENYDNLS